MPGLIRRRWPFVLVALAAMIGTLIHQVADGRRAQAGIAPYRYRFERAARGSVKRALEREIAFHQERLRRDPSSGLELAALGQAYLKMARTTGDLRWYLLAEQAARRSLASLPFNNHGAWLVLARIAEARHDFDEAIRLARQTGDEEDGLAILVSADLARGRIDEAGDAAERLAERAPGLVSLTWRALVHAARGEDDQAAADFHRAILQEEPGEVASSAWARTMLGRHHARRGRSDLAAALYREALAILPEYSAALILLAEVEARAGRYQEAERLLADVTDVSSASPNVYDHAVLRGLGRLKALQGDRAAAAAWWQRAEMRLRSDLAGGAFGHRRELARLLLERDRVDDRAGARPEALALMQAEARVRRDAETLDTLAWALSRAGRWQEARETMRGALRWGIRDAALVYRAGMIEQALGDRRAARRYFEAAEWTDPTFDAQARRALGTGLEQIHERGP